MNKVPIHVLMLDDEEDEEEILNSLSQFEKKSCEAVMRYLKKDRSVPSDMNSEKICLSIQDIGMSGIVGEELLRIIENGSSRIEIIMLAHHQKDQNEYSGNKYGPYDFVY